MKTLPLDAMGGSADSAPVEPVVASVDEPPRLDLPAGDFLDAIPWDGAVPDPDALDAETFLGLL